MPRFIQQDYDPADDSSKGYGGIQRHTKAVVLRQVGEDGCPCGCGVAFGASYHTKTGSELTMSGRFCIGHDARLRGKLIRAHLTGTSVVVIRDDEAAEPTSALEVAKQYEWEPYLKNAELRREGANRNLLQSAMNSKRLVKVGRWEYTGQVVAIFDTPDGGEYEVQYVTKQGETKKTRVPAEQAQEVTA
jgi:hypothetical protein